MTPETLRAWLVGLPKRPTRVEMAKRYSDLLVEHWHDLGGCQCAPLNNAIMARWSIAGLEWIKREAWKTAKQTIRRMAATP